MKTHLTIGLVMGLPYAIGPFVRIWLDHGANVAIMILVAIFVLLSLLWLPGLVRYALEWWAIRKILRRLLSLDNLHSSRKWSLPAPESYMLLRGIGRSSNRDAFKLGLLQLMAIHVVIPEKNEATKPGVAKEIVLKPGSTSMETFTGSLGAIHTLWESSSQITIKEVARRAKQEYGSMEGFATRVVLPKLVEIGLCQLHPTVLTPEGERVRDDLETRMAGILHEMQRQRGTWVGRDYRQILMAAVIGVAVGGTRLTDEANLQPAWHQVESRASIGVAPNDGGSQADLWFYYAYFHQFDQDFQAMDSEVDAGESGGDWGDGIEIG